jgi:UDP-glucose 4-epimerase
MREHEGFTTYCEIRPGLANFAASFAGRSCQMSQTPAILLTGGRGRIAEAILGGCSEEWRVVPYSRAPGGGHSDLRELLDGTGPLRARAIVHCAWSTVPATAEQDSGNTARADWDLVDRLITRLREDPEPPLVVFMSSGAIYGQAPGRASREDDLPHPMGAYATGKLGAEERLRASNLPLCVLRVGNVYALSSRPDDAQGVVGRLVRCALTGSVFQRWGGDSIKDYLHRDDFLSALRLVIERRMVGLWNVGSGVGTSLAALIAHVEQSTGRSLTIESRPAPPWDVADNRLDVSRFFQATGWKPVIDLAEGIRRVVAQMQGALPPPTARTR